MLKFGSSGSDVKKLQNYLNQVGDYGLAEDGQYGAKTQAAVKQYQQRNNLTVDGIAGDQTWGSLNDAVSKLSAGSDNTQSNTGTMESATPETPAKPDYSKYSYDASSDAAYQQALAALQQAAATVPTYKASFDQQLQEAYDRIVNREKFSYDLNSDALYQQYADKYQMMGLQASMDTMGQAAALTGGYGNSYAATAGNQAYQAYLQKLNDVVPELYGMALDQYNAEGDKLLTQYSMLRDMSDDEYNRYLNSMDQYWQNVNYQKQNADEAYDRGYTNWLNSYQMGVGADNTAYTKQQNEYEKLVNLITSTGYTPTAAEMQSAGMSQDQATAYANYYNEQKAASSSKSSGGGGGGGDTSYDNGGVDAADIKAMQTALGITPDGKWGPQSQAEALKKWGTSSAKDAYNAYQKGNPGDTPVFTGTTYEEAVAYLKSNGVADAAGIMTRGEWARRKSSYDSTGVGGAEVQYNNTYAEYIQSYVEGRLNNWK